MRKLFNKYISIPLIICATINLFSCSEDYTVVRISRPEIKDTIYDTTLFKPTLSARVEKFKTPGRPDLDGYVSLSTNAIIHLYIYKKDTLPYNNYVYARSLYYYNKNGKISAVYNDIELPEGSYDFYMLSVYDRNHDRIPEFNFNDAKSDYIYNGLDYLWGVKKGIMINNTSAKTLDFILDRACCELNFNFQSISEDTIFQISNVVIQAPTQNDCSWSLATGVINPATTYTDFLSLRIDSLKATGIILPLETADSLSLSFDAKFNETVNSYMVKIPAPSGKIYQAGYKYDYRIMVKTDTAFIKNDSDTV